MKLSTSFCILIISFFQLNLTLSDYLESLPEKFTELQKLRLDLQRTGIKVENYVQLHYNYTYEQLFNMAGSFIKITREVLLQDIHNTVYKYELNNPNHCTRKAHDAIVLLINNGTTLYLQLARDNTINIIMNSEVKKFQEEWRNITNMITLESDQSTLQCLEMNVCNSANTLQSLECCLDKKIQLVNTFLNNFSTREFNLKIENSTYLKENVENTRKQMHNLNIKTLLKIVQVKEDFRTCISILN